jgi:hypothetical protein
MTNTSSSISQPAEAPPTPRRTWYRPRFSLRLLLIAFTLFAIGFPVWYRWPYKVREVQYPYVGNRPDPTKPPESITTASMQRVWGKEPVKDGPQVTRYSLPNGQGTTTQEFEDGVAHGQYLQRRNNVVVVQGRYERGKREGRWLLAGGRIEQNWRANLLHGRCVIRRDDGTVEELLFDRGKLTHLNGQPVKFAIFDRITEGKIASEKLLWALQQPTRVEFVKTDIRDVVDYLSDYHESQIRVDREVKDSSATKTWPTVTVDLEGITLATALALIAEQAGLECDYRYGMPWITTREKAANWIDLTGVELLQPLKDTPLGRAWDKEIVAETFDQPLDKLITTIFSRYGISCDTTAVQSDDPNDTKFHVRTVIRRQSLKNALAFVLSQTSCRCELRGDILVIRPQLERVDGATTLGATEVE